MKIRQFMNGALNVLQNVHSTELKTAIEAEQRHLHGLKYLDVTQELEFLIQSTILRPLHWRIIKDLIQNGCGYV